MQIELDSFPGTCWSHTLDFFFFFIFTKKKIKKKKKQNKREQRRTLLKMKKKMRPFLFNFPFTFDMATRFSQMKYETHLFN